MVCLGWIFSQTPLTYKGLTKPEVPWTFLTSLGLFCFVCFFITFCILIKKTGGPILTNFTVGDRYSRSPGLNAYYTDPWEAKLFTLVNMASQSCWKLVLGKMFVIFGGHRNCLLINLILLVKFIIDYVTKLRFGLESIVFTVK